MIALNYITLSSSQHAIRAYFLSLKNPVSVQAALVEMLLRASMSCAEFGECKQYASIY